MHFFEYLIKGCAVAQGTYDFRLEKNREIKGSELGKRIADIWEQVRKKSVNFLASGILLGGLGLGALGVAVVIVNPFSTALWIAGAAALTAYIAFTIFAAIRTKESKWQAHQWKQASMQAPRGNSNKSDQTPNKSSDKKNPEVDDILIQAERNLSSRLSNESNSIQLANTNDVLRKNHLDLDAKALASEKLANHYYASGDLKKALEVIKEISSLAKNADARDAFFEKLANHYYASGDLKKALEVIKEISSLAKNADARDAFFEKLANHYYASGDFKKALEVIKEISSLAKNADAKESMFLEIVKWYYGIGELRSALNVLNEISSASKNVDSKEKWLGIIAEHHFRDAKYVDAYNAINHITVNKNLKEIWLKQILIAFYSAGNRQAIIDILANRVSNIIKKQAPSDFQQLYTFVFPKLSEKIAQKIFQENEEKFSSGNIHAVLLLIDQMNLSLSQLQTLVQNIQHQHSMQREMHRQQQHKHNNNTVAKPMYVYC